MTLRLLVFAVLALAASPVRGARLFTSGFETNNTTATEWTAATGSCTFATGAVVRSGTYALRCNPSGASWYVSRTMAAAITTGRTWWFRFYLRIATAPSATIEIARHYNGSNRGAGLQLTNGRILQLIDTNDAQVGSNSSALSLDEWYRIEIKQIYDTNTGEAMVDGSSFASGTITGGVVDGAIMRLGAGVTSTGTADLYYDDIGLNDDTGSFQTSYPGAGQVTMIKPASDTTVTWAKTGANCSGTTNTDCVDDEPGAPDDASGYNDTATAQADKYAIGSVPGTDSGSDMVLMDLVARAGGSTTTGSSTFKLDVWNPTSKQQSAGSTTACDVNGWTFPNTSTGGHFVLDLGTDTAATVATYSIGYEPSAIATNHCRVTALWANVEWIAGVAATPRRQMLLGVGP